MIHNLLFLISKNEAIFAAFLIKPYYDAGLKALAQSAGYPLAAIQNCSQLKRTHNFILEVWEATYRSMLSAYISQLSNQPSGDQLLASISHSLDNISSHNFPQIILDTWKFWVQLVLEDVLTYVGLFLAIRGGDWQLRMTCLKLMAPIFTAFDHNTYQKLISQHVADVLSKPLQILTMFQQGAQYQWKIMALSCNR